MMRWVVLLGLVTPALALAQEPAAAPIEQIEPTDVQEVMGQQDFFGEDYPVQDRVFDIMTGRTLRQGSFFYLVSHRNYITPFNENWFYDYFGLDGGNLKVGLGFRYGVLSNLDVGVFRVNGTVEPFDTYEFDARAQILNRQTSYVDLAVRGGVSWFAQRNQQALGGFGQLLVSTILLERFTLGSGFLYHSNSTNDKKTRTDTLYSMAIPAMAEARIIGGLAVAFESATNVAGYGSPLVAFSFGAKLYSHRHTFHFLFTNDQYVSADGIVTNAWRGPQKWIFAFNITREL